MNGLVRSLIALLDRIPYSLVALAARVFPAAVFWRSGQTKVEGWALNDTARFLFREQYNVPLVDPVVAAYAAAIFEHAFPVLLVLGLATRFSAVALLGMTVVIQVFVYPSAWPVHGVWAACFLIVIAQGPGVLSVDQLLSRGRSR